MTTIPTPGDIDAVIAQMIMRARIAGTIDLETLQEFISTCETNTWPAGTVVGILLVRIIEARTGITGRD